MISGPTPPHPRVVLQDLLPVDDAACGVLESGLEIVEKDLRVGDDLRVDFLARDAAGVPVLVLAVDAEDEPWVPVRILDLDLWFRDNAFLLARGLGALAGEGRLLHWGQGVRVLVVTLGVSSQLYRRLMGLAGIDLTVLELKPVHLRGELHWFLQGVEPWVRRDSTLCVPSAPEGLEDPELSELTERLLLRLGNVSPDLELRGDRFHREVRLGGRRALEISVRDGRLLATVDRMPAIELRSAADADRVLDGVLRRLVTAVEGTTPVPAARVDPVRREPRVREGQRVARPAMVEADRRAKHGVHGA